MKPYSQQKRAKHDHCNICGNLADLSWDHVPPESCLNSLPAKFNSIMAGVPKFKDYQSSQNGIRFRSICTDCNNTLLGRKYDPSLTQFTIDVVAHIYSKLNSPPVGALNSFILTEYSTKVKINRMTRAICGHILAAKNEYDDQTTHDCMLREFFLDPSALPPDGFHLYMWFYPYSTVTIARDFVVKNALSTSFAAPEGMCSIISSFPIAYLLCDEQYSGNLFDLFDCCTTDIDEEVPLSFDFSSCFFAEKILRHPLWPAYVSDNPDGVDMLLASGSFSNSSVFATRDFTL